jgi:hypothetical protein
VVIAPDRFLGSLQDFAAFKRTARPTEWGAMESILKDSSGAMIQNASNVDCVANGASEESGTCCSWGM